jgi:hypothetical protein
MRAGRPQLPRSAIPAGLAAASFALAFAQRPGKTVFDTRIELSADPSLFLHRVAQLWSSTGDLGHLQSGQFVGYLFPMAPWFAFVQWTGMPMWVGQRLWLGALIALAAWGVVRLMDELYSTRRGLAHLTAGVLYAANPYVAVWTTRGSVALLAYAAVPWLMLAAHRGLREPRGWTWPALTGLILAASGAGVNAAIVLWILPAPVALIVYEAIVLRRGLWRVRSFGWRAFLCSLLGVAWWAIPLLLESRYGTDFLSFTEQPSSVWATTSMSESIRLLGYWLLYLGIGGRAVVSLASTYLFSAPVILATFLVPLFAFASVRWTRGWRYGPFFCLLAVAALLVMFAGFPSGTPLRGTLTSLYFDLKPLRFLRTSYKAAPLVGVSLACLCGAGLAALPRRGLRGAALGAVAAAVVVLFALPLFEGRAIDKPQEYGAVPAAWTTAIKDAERTTPPGRRIMLLPGELFGFYRWGETVSSVGPALSKRPILVREVVPYADPHAAQLQDSVDDLIQQGRLVPGQLPPLLGLMGVGQVLVTADSLPAQSGALDPSAVQEALARQPGFERPAASYGPTRTYAPLAGRSGETVRVPDLRRYATPSSRAPGIVRVHPVTGAAVVDGDAVGVTELAANGMLSDDRALFYAGDIDRTQLARLAGDGAALVLTDSNRRRVLGASLLRANQGPTMGSDDPIPRGWPSYDLFGSHGTAAQTVAQYSGLRYLRSPVDPGYALQPERRAYAALDGSLSTAWAPAPFAPIDHRYLEMGFSRPRDVETIRVHPTGGAAELAVSVNGGNERRFALRPGWSSLTLHARAVDKLRVRMVSGVGLDELQIPGLQVRESLRAPQVLTSEARGLDLSHSPVSILLQRSTADFPYRSSGGGDSEPGLERDLSLPVGRTFDLSGWASVSPTASDAALDRLAGVDATWSFQSSGRFEGIAGRRASSAFDGQADTAWIGAGERPWLSVSAPRAFTLDTLQLSRGPADYSFPTKVAVSTNNGVRLEAPVGTDGSVRLGRTITGRDLRIDVIAARGGRLPAVAISEIHAGSLRPPAVNRSGPFATRCGELTVSGGGATADARVTGTLEALDSGGPLRLRGCDKLTLPAGATHLSASAGAAMRPDHLALTSAAPVPLATSGPPGTVSPGGNDGSGTHVRLALNRPAWLVFGESYSSGWHASCRGATGGWKELNSPVPIDGFANGWKVSADCREARFDFRPQRLANVGYYVSGAACIGMLGLLLVPLLRRRRATGSFAAAVEEVALQEPQYVGGGIRDPIVRPGLVLSLTAGVAVALLSGFLFGLRAGAALGPAAAVLLMIGVNARRLLALGALALATIPIIYLVHPAARLNNLSFDFATHYVAAHWAGVAAVWCIAAAALLDARVLRNGGGKPAQEPRPSTNSHGPEPAQPIDDRALAERQRMD